VLFFRVSKGNYPARLKKLLVVAAPFWFKCLVKVLGVLMREKIRDRVMFVDTNELKEIVPADILPAYLGGNVILNHKVWLVECNRLVRNRASTCSSYYYLSNITQNGDFNHSSRKRPLTDSENIENNNQKIFISANGAAANSNENDSHKTDINPELNGINGFENVISHEDIDFNVD
jgi:tyrosine-protein phosphatase non-receptor type 9